MQFDERNEGDYRIFAGAVEAKQGDGYIAALVVSRWRGASKPREAYRDESLACGHRWATANDALSYAVKRGLQVVQVETHRLLC